MISQVSRQAIFWARVFGLAITDMEVTKTAASFLAMNNS